MIGSLMYTMLGSRPNIYFAINKLSQFGSNPDKEHLNTAIQVFQYLKGTQNLWLIYDGRKGTKLFDFLDSD